MSSLQGGAICAVKTIADRNADEFSKQLGQIIKDMQNKGLEVDIQYRANCLNGGVCYHSALITGRKPIEILATTTGEEHE